MVLYPLGKVLRRIENIISVTSPSRVEVIGALFGTKNVTNAEAQLHGLVMCFSHIF